MLKCFGFFQFKFLDLEFSIRDVQSVQYPSIILPYGFKRKISPYLLYVFHWYFTMHLLRLRTYSYVKTVNNFFFKQRDKQWMFSGLTSCNTKLWSCPWKRAWTICRSERCFSIPYLQPQASEPQTLRCSIAPPSQSKSPILPNNHFVIKNFAVAPKAVVFNQDSVKIHAFPRIF